MRSETRIGFCENRLSRRDGRVFRARDTRLNRDVAVKVLQKDFASETPACMSREEVRGELSAHRIGVEA
jgi:hypothetical protein